MHHHHHHLFKNYSLVRKLNIHFSVLWILYWMGWTALWGFLSVYLLHRGFTNAQIGLVTGCNSLLWIFIQPALATFCDRNPRFSSRRLAMVLAVILMVCGTAAWLSDSILLTSVLLVISGVAVTNIPPHFNAMNMNMALRGLDVNFSASRSCGSVTYALTSLVMGAALEHFAPTLVLPIFLLAFSGLLLALLLFRYPLPDAPAYEAKNTPVVLSNAALLRRYPRFTLVLVACFLLVGSQNAITTYMIHIAAKVGGGETTTGTAYFISGIVELPAMLLFTKVRRKVPLRTLLPACSVFFVVRAGALLLAATPPAMFLACSLQFFAYAILAVSTVYFAAQEIDIANQVKAQALIYTASSGVGAAFGSLCGGRLLDWGGVNAMLTFCCLSAAAGMCLMTFALQFKRPKGAKP